MILMRFHQAVTVKKVVTAKEAVTAKKGKAWYFVIGHMDI